MYSKKTKHSSLSLSLQFIGPNLCRACDCMFQEPRIDAEPFPRAGLTCRKEPRTHVSRMFIPPRLPAQQLIVAHSEQTSVTQPPSVPAHAHAHKRVRTRRRTLYVARALESRTRNKRSSGCGEREKKKKTSEGRMRGDARRRKPHLCTVYPAVVDLQFFFHPGGIF